MPADRYGLALATSSPAARDSYVAGCDLVLTLYPGAVAEFDRAIAADPAFALAHAGRARALQMQGDIPAARAAIAMAEALANGRRERDPSHIEILALLIGGKPSDALAAIRRHGQTWPRDALIVSLAANQTGLIGTSGLAGREQDQLDFLAALAPHYGDDWWFNSHYAMALSELGERAAAWARIERSIADRPRNAYAAHALAHYHYEAGETADTRSFLDPWLAGYPREGLLHGHLSWHLALAHLEEGDVEAGLRLYDAAFAAEDYPGPPLIKLLDGPSFLWRAELAGHPRDQARWQALGAFARSSFPRPGMPFADWHLALIDAVLADATSAQARAREMSQMVESGRYAAGGTVLAVAHAFAAFERRDFATAIDAILSMFEDRARICGSRAQIDLVEFTLLKAYLATGRLEEARRLAGLRRSGTRRIPVAGLIELRQYSDREEPDGVPATA